MGEGSMMYLLCWKIKTKRQSDISIYSCLLSSVHVYSQDHMRTGSVTLSNKFLNGKANFLFSREGGMGFLLSLTVLGYFEHPTDWGGGGGAWEAPPPLYDLGRRLSDEHENLHVCIYLRKEQDGIISFFRICKFLSLA